MENNYQYLDPEYKYTNKNGVLHNLANIVNERILIAFDGPQPSSSAPLANESNNAGIVSALIKCWPLFGRNMLEPKIIKTLSAMYKPPYPSSVEAT